MLRLTLRTLLAYIDDTLEPAQARELGLKVADSADARELTERIKKVTRRRGLHTPLPTGSDSDVSDPNTVAEYLSNNLDADAVAKLEERCLKSDVHLAEVAACHQILTLVLTEPVRVPPRANQRMYQLVGPPASRPKRKPGKTLPVGGVRPGMADKPEADEADAALLLGMNRYSSTAPRSNRLALLAAVAALAAGLVLAVWMAWPHTPAAGPDVHYGPVSYAQLPAKPNEANDGKDGVAPDPRPKPMGTPEMPPVDPIPPVEPDIKKAPDPAEQVAPGSKNRLPVGRVATPNVIVLTHPDAEPDAQPAPWTRLSPDGDAVVTGYDEVVALPGYKADVNLDSGAVVRLWGNVPELLPSRLLESRVRFHATPKQPDDKGQTLDADLTLLAGRVFVGTRKPGGATVRLRFADEVWDITLADEKSDIMAEVTTAFVPGTPYAREGGESPRTEATVAVLHGAATIKAPKRYKEFAKVAAPAVLTWDSRTGKVADPKPIDPAALPYFAKFTPVESDQGKAVQKALTDLATGLTDKAGIKVLLAQRLTEPADPSRILTTRVAIYAQAAIASGAAGGDDLKPLLDPLTEETRGYARLAAVNALAAWVAQNPGNSAALHKQLVEKARFKEDDADLAVRLLRGYAASPRPDSADLDKLAESLSHPSVAIRELALWNLVNFVDPDALRPGAGLVTDVAITGPAYDTFVKRWKGRIEEIKKRPEKK